MERKIAFFYQKHIYAIWIIIFVAIYIAGFMSQTVRTVTSIIILAGTAFVIVCLGLAYLKNRKPS
jgi:hypothetical protein